MSKTVVICYVTRKIQQTSLITQYFAKICTILTSSIYLFKLCICSFLFSEFIECFAFTLNKKDCKFRSKVKNRNVGRQYVGCQMSRRRYPTKVVKMLFRRGNNFSILMSSLENGFITFRVRPFHLNLLSIYFTSISFPFFD